MRKRTGKKQILKKAITLTAVSALLLMTVMGCSNSKSKTDGTGNGTSDSTTKLSGTIRLSGSTSMEKLANALAEAFMEENPNVTVTPEFNGSSAGIEAVTNGTVDIGNSSRELTEEEKAAGATSNVVAIDGIAVITDKENQVTDLTSDQLKQIYQGQIKNWKELGGKDEAIVVIGREAGSGTRGAFEELMGVEDTCQYSNELDSTGAVLAKVGATPGAIGYVSLDVLDDSVNPVKLDGVEPTEENIVSGDYTLSRPFVMATKGAISEQSELVQAFFTFIQSDAGQNVITTVGLILPQ